MAQALLAKSRGQFSVIDVGGVGTEAYYVPPNPNLDLDLTEPTTIFVVVPGTFINISEDIL